MAIDKITLGATDNLFENTEFTGTDGIKVPEGTTAERPSGDTGLLRFNTTIGKLEQYDGSGFRAIDAPPTISGISSSAIAESDSSFDLTVTGDNFSTAAITQAIGQDGSTINATSTSRTSATQLVATFNGTAFDNAQEPYSIKVTNNTGLAITYADVLYVNATPSWTTSASPTVLATIYNDNALSSVSVSATDSEGASLTYSLSSGSFPTGVTLNSDGTITGTPSGGTYSSGGESFTPTVSVTDGTNSTTRTFNILRKWKDGTTSALAAVDAKSILDLGLNSYGNGTPEKHWIQTPSGPKNVYCKFHGDGWGWMLSHTFGGVLGNNITITDADVLVKAGFWMTSEQMGNLPDSYTGMSGTMSNQVDTKLRFKDDNDNFQTGAGSSDFWAIEGTANGYPTSYGSNADYFTWWAHSGNIGSLHLCGDLSDVYPSTVTHGMWRAYENANTSQYSKIVDYQGNAVQTMSSDAYTNDTNSRVPLGTLSSTGSHMAYYDGNGSTADMYYIWVGNQ